MQQSEFIGMLILGVGAIAAFMTPIIKLNTSIVELNATMKSLREMQDSQNGRITKHGGELDDVKEHVAKQDIKLENHESRLKSLEEEK